jgi:hypothetical protein
VVSNSIMALQMNNQSLEEAMNASVIQEDVEYTAVNRSRKNTAAFDLS